MPDKAGTLEKLLIELGLALQPLGHRLQADQFQEFFSELGLNFPDSLLGNAGFMAALNATTTAAGDLVSRVNALSTAIQEDDISNILSQSAQTANAIASVISALDTIASELQTLAGSIPDLSPTDVNEFAEHFTARAFDFLVVRYLEGFHPLTLNGLALLGVIEFNVANFGSADPHKPATTRRVLRLERLSRLLRDPSSVLENVYRWATADLRGEDLLWRLFDLFHALGIPASFDVPEAGGPAIRLLGLRIGITSGIPIPGLVLSNEFDRSGGISRRMRFLVPGWAVEVSLNGNIQAGLEAHILPLQKVILIPPSGEVEADARVRVFAQPVPPATSVMLLGEAGGSRVEAALVTLGVGTSFEWNSSENQAEGEVVAEAALFGGKVLIDTTKGDGFLARLTSGVKVEADFDLRAVWNLSSGLRFEGRSASTIQLPVRVSLGPIELTSLYVVLDPADESGIPLEISSALRAQLGPLHVVIDRIGLKALLTFPEDGGNLGPAQFGVDFKPPTGIGLSIDGGGFKGGGFLAFDGVNARYTGILQLEFQNQFVLQAIGLVTTKLPDGRPGFSLLIIISSADFTPIQLGFGFTLTGVGGLLGLNRTMNIERLREGIKTNSLDHILFPTDPIANAARIISDLGQVFPPQEGRFVFGPMAQIGWGTPPLITGEFGLFIEVPNPIRVALLGVIKALLPNEERAILQLQVNFLGTWEEDKRLIALDASLFDSRLLNLPLAGDMALRLAYGENPNFLVTVGGFHPAYALPPLALPPLARLTVHLTRGDNPRLTLAAYFALTSNTAQFGAKIELLAKAGKFNVYGFLAFDALFQFSPFRFIVAIGGEVAVRAGSSVLFSIGLKLTLSGPTPWNAKGTASFKILFFKVKVRFDKTWGEERDTTLSDVAVLPKLVAALQHKNNWQAQLPSRHHLLVSIRDINGDHAADIVAHPAGMLTVSQKVVPLDTPIDRFGSQKPADARRFTIKTVRSIPPDGTIGTTFNKSTVEEFFAPAQFEELDDAQRLSRPSFERMPAGVKVSSTTTDIQSSKVVSRHLVYETIILDTHSRRLPLGKFLGERLGTFSALLRGNAVAKSRLSFVNNAEPVLGSGKIAVAQEGYAVVGTGDLLPFDGNASFGSETGAQRYMQELIRQHPALASQIQVVPNYEVQTAG